MTTTTKSSGTPLHSLLSLSVVAASADPMPISQSTSSASSGLLESGSYSNSMSGFSPSSYSSSLKDGKFHKKVASQGRMKRRLSDARDAASRPSSLQPSTALSLASLTLSSSSPITASFPGGHHTDSESSLQSFASTHGVPSAGTPASLPVSGLAEELLASRRGSLPNVIGLEPPTGPQVTVAPVPISKNGKKRGTDFKCESCSKIYRHPSCLIKHRWEHTPHWKESSKYVLSKHQQVQLLEAAAILSHLAPTSTSLPEDRSLWPSFLSGGTLPLVVPSDGSSNPSVNEKDAASPPASSPLAMDDTGDDASPKNGVGSYAPTHLSSSSVPATSALNLHSSTRVTRGSSTGPRLHDFSIPGSNVKRVGSGVIGVSNASSTPTSLSVTPKLDEHERPGAVPISVPRTSYNHSSYRSSGSYATPPPSSLTNGSYYQSGSSFPSSFGLQSVSQSVGVSLPSSSVRSGSASRSRSGSDSRGSDDVEIDDIKDDSLANVRIRSSSSERESYDLDHGSRGRHGYGYSYGRQRGDEDDLDMDMDVDTASAYGGHHGRGPKAAAATASTMEDVSEEEWDGEMEMEMD